MGAGAPRAYRHLSRTSAHRQALLRNLATTLIENETLSTTWPKAKEAQRLVEKLITLGKRNTEASKRKAWSVLYVWAISKSPFETLNQSAMLTDCIQKPVELIPKLFGPLRERYESRPGGYTRVLRIEPKKEDQAPSAILELVDSPRDMRFGLTAQTIARDQKLQRPHTPFTLQNKAKVTAFRENGEQLLQEMVDQFKSYDDEGIEGERKFLLEKKKVYKGLRNELYYPQGRKEREDQMQPSPRGGAFGIQGGV